MPETNADVVVAIAAAVADHDLDALLELIDENVEHRDARESTGLRGREEIRRYFLDLWAESPDASFEVGEIVETGDWVIARQRWRGLAEGDLTTWVAREFAGGRVRRVEVYETRAEALEATAR